MGGLVIFAILLMILGSLLRQTGSKDKDVMERVNIRITNLMTITQSYGKITKSSTLRSVNASLYSVLNNTSATFSPLITSVYGIDAKTSNAKITADEESIMNDLKTDLDYAKLNGLLDRTYSREIALQIGLLLSLESEASERTKDQNIKNVLNESYSNLSTLYTKFSEYSEASSSIRDTSN